MKRDEHDRSARALSKAFPVVLRTINGAIELLAFRHPAAGNQLVKGTIERGEDAAAAACRELFEESGVNSVTHVRHLATSRIGQTGQEWHFYLLQTADLPETWDHRTFDDCGHVFSFFWHPLAEPLNADWHRDYRDAIDVIRSALSH